MTHRFVLLFFLRLPLQVPNKTRSEGFSPCLCHQFSPFGIIKYKQPTYSEHEIKIHDQDNELNIKYHQEYGLQIFHINFKNNWTQGWIFDNMLYILTLGWWNCPFLIINVINILADHILQGKHYLMKKLICKLSDNKWECVRSLRIAVRFLLSDQDVRWI